MGLSPFGALFALHLQLGAVVVIEPVIDHCDRRKAAIFCCFALVSGPFFCGDTCDFLPVLAGRVGVVGS